MAAPDRYIRKLSCPNCGNTGEVHYAENDGQTFMNRGPERRVTSVTAGFSKIRRDGNEEVRCECGTDPDPC